jgi:hypothetical protein
VAFAACSAASAQAAAPVTSVYLAHLTFPFKVTCQMVGGASGHITCETVTGHGAQINWMRVDSRGASRRV